MIDLSSQMLTMLGAMYALLVTLWAICLPTIRESKVGYKEFGWAYLLVTASIPTSQIALNLIENEAILTDSASTHITVWEGLFMTTVLGVFVGFAILVYSVLDRLSRN
ncbi:MAG: hypothetical protein ABNH53_05510 [Henriciella sp.]|jgi:ABC-type nitrate/sulfonate/bicarbonate transport system permease component